MRVLISAGEIFIKKAGRISDGAYSMHNRSFLIIAAVLMILLGLARGAGGVLLLVQGRVADPAILASSPLLQILAAALVAIGLVEIMAAVGTLKLKRSYWLLGIVVTVLFVVDGAINGYFFYGQPGDIGTAVNLAVAFLILLTLFLGRKALG